MTLNDNNSNTNDIESKQMKKYRILKANKDFSKKNMA